MINYRKYILLWQFPEDYFSLYMGKKISMLEKKIRNCSITQLRDEKYICQLIDKHSISKDFYIDFSRIKVEMIDPKLFSFIGSNNILRKEIQKRVLITYPISGSYNFIYNHCKSVTISSDEINEQYVVIKLENRIGFIYSSTSLDVFETRLFIEDKVKHLSEKLSILKKYLDEYNNNIVAVINIFVKNRIESLEEEYVFLAHFK